MRAYLILYYLTKITSYLFKMVIGEATYLILLRRGRRKARSELSSSGKQALSNGQAVPVNHCLLSYISTFHSSIPIFRHKSILLADRRVKNLFVPLSESSKVLLISFSQATHLLWVHCGLVMTDQLRPEDRSNSKGHVCVSSPHYLQIGKV